MWALNSVGCYSATFAFKSSRKWRQFVNAIIRLIWWSLKWRFDAQRPTHPFQENFILLLTISKVMMALSALVRAKIFSNFPFLSFDDNIHNRVAVRFHFRRLSSAILVKSMEKRIKLTKAVFLTLNVDKKARAIVLSSTWTFTAMAEHSTAYIGVASKTKIPQNACFAFRCLHRYFNDNKSAYNLSSGLWMDSSIFLFQIEIANQNWTRNNRQMLLGLPAGEEYRERQRIERRLGMKIDNIAAAHCTMQAHTEG